MRDKPYEVMIDAIMTVFGALTTLSKLQGLHSLFRRINIDNFDDVRIEGSRGSKLE